MVAWETLALECKLLHWGCLQRQLRAQLVADEDLFTDVHYVAGVDVSFASTRPGVAVAACVVVDATQSDLPVVQTILEKVTLTEPYVSGFLAFREVEFLRRLIGRIPPDVYPQVILVDGNGVLHPNGFGLASHLGVVCGVPTIGVAKTLCNVDGLADEEGPLVGESGRTYGYALRTGKSRHIYVSVGYGVTMNTAVSLVRRLALYRVPEPIRQADLRSRAAVRDLERQWAKNKL